ncbi:MAG: CHAT domain-containing protein [Gemmatimonadota bacterium]
MEYLDFELRIMPGAGREYPVSVLRSPAGETSTTMHFPFDTLALQNQLQGIEIAVLRSGGTRRDVAMDEHLGVSDFGRRLFEALMTDTVRETFRRSRDRARAAGKGLRLRLRIEAPELAALPWEYLYDPSEGDFVCLSTDTPVVRYLEFDRPPEALTIRPPLSILGLIASPTDRATLDVERERQRIEASTAPLRKAGLLKLTWLGGSTWRDLQKAMRQGPYHIFHFVGHGGFDNAANEGVIALTDDDGKSALMSATQLGRLLADHQSLRMVVLNSCLGAKGSATDVFSSTASILIRRGVSAVVAMQYEISDLAAVEFARSLYEALADGIPVDAAVAEARKAISLSVNNTVEWGTPVLHMRSPDGMLFRIDGVTTSKARASGTYPSLQALKADAPLPVAPRAAPPAERVASPASPATTVPSVPPLKPAATPPAPVAPVVSSARTEPTIKAGSGAPSIPPPKAPTKREPLAEPPSQAERSADGAAAPRGVERPVGESKKLGGTARLLVLAAFAVTVAIVVLNRTRRGSISIEVQEPANTTQLPPEWTASQAKITGARFIAVSDTKGMFSIVVGHIVLAQDISLSTSCNLDGAAATISFPLSNGGGEYSGDFQVHGVPWPEGPRHAKCEFVGKGTIWEGDVEWTRPPGSSARASAAVSTSGPQPEPTPAVEPAPTDVTTPRSLVAAGVSWASTRAKLRQVNASFLSPGNWQLRLTVDYTTPKSPGNAMVDCSLRKGEPEQQEILVEVPLLPGRKGGDYMGLVQPQQAWGPGPYGIQCQVDGTPVYQGQVSWAGPR